MGRLGVGKLYTIILFVDNVKRNLHLDLKIPLKRDQNLKNGPFSIVIYNFLRIY